jgi:hypothetical protein
MTRVVTVSFPLKPFHQAKGLEKAFTHLGHAALECCPELLAGLLILLNLLAAHRQLSLTAAAGPTCKDTKKGR